MADAQSVSTTDLMSPATQRRFAPTPERRPAPQLANFPAMSSARSLANLGKNYKILFIHSSLKYQISHLNIIYDPFLHYFPSIIILNE